MTNVFRRPMFRKGGRVDSRGTGITSGLDTPKRGLVDGPGGYAGDVVESYKEKLARLQAERPALSLGDYLQIAATGAQIAGAPGRGGGLGDALVAASGPLANLGMGLSKSMSAREAGTRELAGQLTGLEIERELKEKGLDSKSYADTNKINLIRASLAKIAQLEKSKEGLSEAEQQVIDQQIENEQKILQTLYGRDVITETIIDQLLEEGVLSDFLEEYKKKNEGRSPTLQEIREHLLRKRSVGKADGGRVGFEEGGAVETVMDPMQEQPETEKPVELSYDELRARLPQEISDDIVTLLSTSYEALADFAQIQTQADVNAFNSKYQVNLVLPQEA